MYLCFMYLCIYVHMYLHICAYGVAVPALICKHMRYITLQYTKILGVLVTSTQSSAVKLCHVSKIKCANTENHNIERETDTERNSCAAKASESERAKNNSSRATWTKVRPLLPTMVNRTKLMTQEC